MKTATQIKLEEEHLRFTYQLLAEHPHIIAEKIARHYLAHAKIAQEILALLEVRASAGSNRSNPSFDSLITSLIGEIQNNHAHDFGIKLEWPKSTNFIYDH